VYYAYYVYCAYYVYYAYYVYCAYYVYYAYYVLIFFLTFCIYYYCVEWSILLHIDAMILQVVNEMRIL
jgi:hypothetical protein